MVPISNVVTMPSLGSTTNVIRHDYVDTDYSNPQKGITNGSESDIVVGIDPSGDTGQTQLNTASADGVGKYVISVTRLDGTVSYAWGIISGDEENGGETETFNERNHMFTLAARHVTYTP